jgi:hypothetical protein
MFIADGGYVFAIGGNNTNAAGTFCTYVCSANTLYGNHYGYIQTQVASLTSGSIGSWAALTGTSQFSSIFYNPNGGLFQGDAPAQCALVGSDIYCGGSIGMTSNSNPQSTAPFGEFTTVSGGSLGAWATIVNTAGPGNGGVGCVGFQSDYTCIMAGQVTQGHGDTITLTSKTGDTIVYSGGGLGSWSNSSTLSPYGSGHLDYRTASSGLPSSCVTDGSSYITCINLSGYTGNYFVTTGAIIVNPCDSTFSTSANYQVLCLTFPNSSALSVVTQSSTYQSSASTASCTLTATAGDLLVVAIATSFNIVSYNAPTDSATNYYVFTTGMNSTLFNYFGGLAGANLIVGSALSGFSGADTIHAAEGTGAYTTFCYDIHGANYGSQTGAFSKGTGSAVATSIDTLAGQLTVAIMGQSSSGTFTEGSGFYLNSGGTIHDTVGGDYWASETNTPGSGPVSFTLAIIQNESGSPQTFNIGGCSVSPTTITGNGLPEGFSSTMGCPIHILNVANSTARIVFPGGSSEEFLTPVANGTYSYTYDYQLNVTVVTNNPSASSISPSGTNWVDYGHPLTITVQVTDNNYNLPVGRFVSWSATGGVFIASPTLPTTTAVPTSYGVVTADVATVVYTIAQPNPATVSFWVFPIIILVFFALYFFMIAARNGASVWARNYMLLTGMVVGAVITMMTATLDALVLLLALILWMFYVYRG